MELSASEKGLHRNQESVISVKDRYCDIVQAEIVNTGRGPCLFIKLRERRFKKRVCIDCVDNKALDELLIDLR